MAKDQNLSIETDESDTGAFLENWDVSRVVEQRLESFRRSGIDLIPVGTGQYEFDLSFNDQPAVEETPSAQVQERKPSHVQPASEAAVSPQAPPAKPSQEVAAAQTQQEKTVAAPASSSAGQFSESYGPSVPDGNRESALKVIEAEVAGCTICEELCSMRTNTVFGVGSPRARLVFVGEGPGADEDRDGEPFVGAAGQLLDKILGACGLSRSEVYILNTVKCRPPRNRNPSQDELANCWGYAERQLEILQPEFICCLGSVAAKTVLKSTQSLGRMRKTIHQYRGSKVLVTYHPAYLLRTPSAKKHVWEDMKMLMEEMGIEVK